MNKLTVAVLSAVGGGVAGGAITYLTVNKSLRKRHEEWAEREIAEVKRHYAQLNEDSKRSFIDLAENPSPEIRAAVEAGKELIEKMGYSGLGTPEHPEDNRPDTLSIFDQGVDESEEPYLQAMDRGYKAVEGEPFLISEAEYFENEPDYQLDTLTYYETDDTLTDEHNAQIDRVDETIGARHLSMFPKKRNMDKTSLYIRNDDHETLYEVILVEQSYAAVILGMSEEELGLKEPKRRPGKMPKDHD